MTRLQGRTAFVTGGAQGIGLGIARALARRGVRLALADADRDALSRVALDAATFVLDVRDRDAFARVADLAEERLGPVSLLFNNAGVAGRAPVESVAYEHWDWMYGINIGGVVNGVQTFMPRMVARGDGHIVNTSSGAGLAMAGTGTGFLYQSSKAAVVAMSESLRVELEPHGIGVSVLCPGRVATRIAESSARAKPDGAQTGTADTTAWLARGTSPDEVGEMVCEAILDNRLYIHTDTKMAKWITARTDAILSAMPEDAG